MTLGEFADAVRAYALITGASATSWGRTEKHNEAVGGVKYSAHRFWLAADLVYDGPPPPDAVAVAHRLGLKLIEEGDHHHVQPLGWIAG